MEEREDDDSEEVSASTRMFVLESATVRIWSMTSMVLVLSRVSRIVAKTLDLMEGEADDRSPKTDSSSSEMMLPKPALSSLRRARRSRAWQRI